MGRSPEAFYAPIAALLVTLLFRRFNLELTSYLFTLALFAAGWIVVVMISSPWEPVLLVTPTTISVVAVAGRGSPPVVS